MISGIHIGHTEQAVKEVTASILSILNARADQKTIQDALAVFATAVKIENVSITGCNIEMPAEVPKYRKKTA